MRALDVFEARHRFAYDIFYSDLFNRYDETQLRTPPHPSMNTLAWLIWHVARVEDAGVSRFVMREPQLLHAERWNEKLKLDVDHFGFGAPRPEMLAISDAVDLAALQGYFQAVRRRALASLSTLESAVLDEVLAPEEVNEVMFVEGVALPQMTEVIGIYSGWTRLEALYHFSVTHYYWHGGEVRTLEGMIAADA